MTAHGLQHDNRRQHQRIEAEGATADVIREGRDPVTYAVANLSEGGALLRGPIDDPIGTIVALSVSLTGVPPVGVKAKIVRHQREDGHEYVAVCFQAPAAQLREAIHELVLQALQRAFDM